MGLVRSVMAGLVSLVGAEYVKAWLGRHGEVLFVGARRVKAGLVLARLGTTLKQMRR